MNSVYFYIKALAIKFNIYSTIQNIRDCISNSRLKIHNEGAYRICRKHVVGENNVLSIGKKSELKNINLFIEGDNNTIKIGDKCYMNNDTFRIIGNNLNVCIGDNTTSTRLNEFNANGASIYIGKDNMLSNNIIIRTSDDHPIYNKEGFHVNLPKDVIIGNHVWIAPKSTIMKGVSIGEGSVIATCAVVTRDVQSNAIAGGIPSKILKTDIRWERK